MGAWGVGLQESDTALDIIYELREEIKKAVEGHIDSFEVLKKALWDEEWGSEDMLATAEYLMDEGVSLQRDDIRAFLIPYIEKAKARADDFTDPDGRRKTIDAFAIRIGEKK